MGANKITYYGKVLIDLTSDSVTPETLAEGVTAHDKSGAMITGTMSANTKTYEITLAKASGWVLLTTLDSEVVEHINDASLVVSLVNISPYAYEWYAGSMYIASNTPFGYNGSYPSYGLSCRLSSETACQADHIYYPPNYTKWDTGIGGKGQFTIEGNDYWFRPSDGFIKAGTYRLTFTW
jgi:hypothetical protein